MVFHYSLAAPNDKYTAIYLPILVLIVSSYSLSSSNGSIATLIDKLNYSFYEQINTPISIPLLLRYYYRCYLVYIVYGIQIHTKTIQSDEQSCL
jgi:hypothetical protein